MKNTLTIVGIGPGDRRFMTMEAIDTLKESKKIYFRTHKHPVVDYIHSLGVKSLSYDYVYEESEKFDEVYISISNKVLKELDEEDITYVVPGNPFVAEKTVELLKKRVEEDGKHNIKFMNT